MYVHLLVIYTEAYQNILLKLNVSASVHRQQQSTPNKIPKKQLLPRAYLRLSSGHHQPLRQENI
jgi:hypothetical protein